MPFRVFVYSGLELQVREELHSGKNLEASPINICRKGNKYPAHPTMTTAATNTGDVTGFGDVLVYGRRNLK